jgi:hypothetical protein
MPYMVLNEEVDNVVISARDTDVLLLLLAHKERITSKVWLWAGTSKKPKYIPLDKVFNNLNSSMFGTCFIAIPCNHWM